MQAPGCGSPGRGCTWSPASSRARVREGDDRASGRAPRGYRYLELATPPQTRLAALGLRQVGEQPALVQEASPGFLHEPGRAGDWGLRRWCGRRPPSCGWVGGCSWPSPHSRPHGSGPRRCGEPESIAQARLRETFPDRGGERDVPRPRGERTAKGHFALTFVRTLTWTSGGSHLRGRVLRRMPPSGSHGCVRSWVWVPAWLGVFYPSVSDLQLGRPRGGAGRGGAGSAGPPPTPGPGTVLARGGPLSQPFVPEVRGAGLGRGGRESAQVGEGSSVFLLHPAPTH